MSSTLRFALLLLALLPGALKAQSAQDNWTLDFSFGGATTHGQLQQPTGLAATADGKLAVVDSQNHRIQVFNADGTFAFRFGAQGNIDGSFEFPQGIAAIPAGGFVVSDSTNRIQVFDANGNFVRKWGGSGSGEGQFNNPNGIVVLPSGNVVVVDTGNNRVQTFSATGTFIRQWGGFNSSYPAANYGKFYEPLAVVLLADGNLGIADRMAVQVFDIFGNFQWIWYFSSPYLAVDSAGKIYASNTSEVKIYSSTGSALTAFGSAGTGNGQFRAASGVAILPDGKIAVADSQRHDVQIFDGNGTFVSKFGQYGKVNDGFGYVVAMEFGPDGLLYVADNHLSYPALQVFTADGTPIRQSYIATTLRGVPYNIQPTTMRIGPTGRIHLFYNAGIYIFEPSLAPFAYLGGTTTGSGDGSFAPQSVTFAIDANGDVYASDPGNTRIQVFSADGTFLRKFPIGGGSALGDGGSGLCLTHDGLVMTSEKLGDTFYLNRYTKSGDPVYHTSFSGDAIYAKGPDGLLYGSTTNDSAGKIAAVFGPDFKSLATLGSQDSAPPAVNPNTGAVYVFNRVTKKIDVWRRGFRTLGANPPKVVPMPGIRSVAQRANGYIDVDYIVTDGDSAQVATAMAAFKTGSTLLRDLVPVNTADLKEGTSINLGGSIPTGVVHRITWDPTAVNLPAGELVFEVFARDDRPGLMDIDFITLPSGLQISRIPVLPADMRPAWAWLLLNGDPSLTQASNGEIVGPGGAFTYTSGTGAGAESKTTNLGRAWLFAKLGVREATNSEVTEARQATSAGTPNQFIPVPSQQMGSRPRRVNEWTFDSADTYGTEAWWVVKLP